MSIERRTLIRALAGGGAGGFALSVAGMGVAASVKTARSKKTTSPAKATKKMAEYQDRPKDVFSCSICSLFEKPKSCKVIEGEVSPNGWCNLFSLAD
jgi:hypothetical protein